MSENQAPQTVINHVSLGTNHFDKATVFYDRVGEALGMRRIMEHPGAVAYGRGFPELWIQTPLNGAAATVANGSHIAFMADSKEMVDAFYKAAMAAGATDDGAPGPRPMYTDAYYGCFVRDLDGHKIEATYWDVNKAKELGIG